MKKSFFMMAAFASLMAFTACSSDDEFLADGNTPNNGEMVVEDGDVLEISLSNTSKEGRAARPIGSSAAANNVNYVQLKVYDQDGTEVTDVVDVESNSDKNLFTLVEGQVEAKKGANKGLFHITATDSQEAPNAGNSHIDAPKTIKLKCHFLKQGTTYRIVAYGYNSEDGTNPYGEVTDSKGLFTTKTEKTGYAVEELFAGEVTASTKSDAPKFTTAPAVVLERQVAGMLAYFKVPVMSFGKKVEFVKVVANDESKVFTFPSSADFNGVTTGMTKKAVELMVFDMSKVASNHSTAKDGFYESTANAGLAENYKKPNGLQLLPNTFFGARYLIPYDHHYGAQTLTVQLCDADKNIIKSIKVISNQSTSYTDGGNKYEYDIRRNNFYSIGKKLKSDGTDGPTPDPDKPIDLGASDQILVEINDAWDVLHDMDIEE